MKTIAHTLCGDFARNCAFLAKALVRGRKSSFPSSIFHPRSSLVAALQPLHRCPLAAGLLLLPGCGPQPENRRSEAPTLPPASVRAQTVRLKPQASFEEVVGTVRAKLRATLEARVSGSIQQMPVALGQSVKAGDLISRLHAPEVQARLEQARANLQQAEEE